MPNRAPRCRPNDPNNIGWNTVENEVLWGNDLNVQIWDHQGCRVDAALLNDWHPGSTFLVRRGNHAHDKTGMLTVQDLCYTDRIVNDVTASNNPELLYHYQMHILFVLSHTDADAVLSTRLPNIIVGLNTVDTVAYSTQYVR